MRFLSEIKSNNLPFGQSFFLQTEQGRLHLIHKDKNTYCIHHTCGNLTNIKKSGFDFTFNKQTSTAFFKTMQKGHFKKSFKNDIPKINTRFSFKYKTNQDILNINVTQEGDCYNNNTKMPFTFVAGYKHIQKETNIQRTFSVNEMDILIFKKGTNDFFTLKNKNNIYQDINNTTQNQQLRFLLLVSSYKRPIYLINQLHSFLNQTYKQENFDFAVSVKGIDEATFSNILKPNFQHLINKKMLFLQQHENKDQFTNLLNTYKDIDITSYDYLCKIDDDDWYHKNYLSTLNLILSIADKPKFITSSNLFKTTQMKEQLFLTKTQMPFVGATICFSKEFALQIKELKNKIPTADKIYEDNFLNILAHQQNSKYIYLTSSPLFIYNQSTPSITRFINQ